MLPDEPDGRGCPSTDRDSATARSRSRLTSPTDSIVAAAQRVQAELGGADVLVNNAGVMLFGLFGPDQRADYRQMIEVNLIGAITPTEVFLDQLKDGGGDIINISSVAGRTARPGNGVYAATKWGINGWSESLG